MKFDIKPEDYENFKEFFANKLREETGEIYIPEDIYLAERNKNGGFIKLFYDDDLSYKYIFSDVSFGSFHNSELNGVEYIHGNAESLNDIEKINDLRIIKGCLSLSGSKVSNLGKLEYVGEDVIIMHSNLRNFDSLKKIDGSLSIYNCKYIESLNNIESIGKSLTLNNITLIEDLGNLEYVGGNVDLKNINLEIPRKMKRDDGYVKIAYYKIKYLLKLKIVCKIFNLTL